MGTKRTRVKADPVNLAAYRAGRLARVSGQPLNACPFDPKALPVLARWFVIGYRAAKRTNAVSYR